MPTVSDAKKDAPTPTSARFELSLARNDGDTEVQFWRLAQRPQARRREEANDVIDDMCRERNSTSTSRTRTFLLGARVRMGVPKREEAPTAL